MESETSFKECKNALESLIDKLVALKFLAYQLVTQKLSIFMNLFFRNLNLRCVM